MSAYDVRDNAVDEITEIVFADENTVVSQACVIHHDGGGHLLIEDEADYVHINSKEHALNLIKALNMAIELEWVV